MFGKIAFTWELMRSSWEVLRKDKTFSCFLFCPASAALPS